MGWMNMVAHPPIGAMVGIMRGLVKGRVVSQIDKVGLIDHPYTMAMVVGVVTVGEVSNHSIKHLPCLRQS